MKDTFRTCPVCGTSFPRNNKTMYCTDECKKIASRVLGASGNGFFFNRQKEKFEALLNYVEQNNLKKILKKYKPKKRKSTNENA